MNGLRAKIRVTDYANRIEVAVIHQQDHGRLVGKPLMLTDIGDNAVAEPTFTLDREGAQALADELAENGFAPTDAKLGLSALRERIAHLEKQLERVSGVAIAATELLKP